MTNSADDAVKTKSPKTNDLKIDGVKSTKADDLGNPKTNDPFCVDMINSAKNAQWSPDFLEASRIVKVISPSKVNLFLSIGDKRGDGYHDAVNIMHTLALHDTLYLGARDCPMDASSQSKNCFSEVNSQTVQPKERSQSGDFALAGPNGNIVVRIDISDKTVSPYDAPLQIPVEQNLVFKAIDLLAREIERSNNETIEVRIEKSIPAQAGLAGGSGNACAALVACAKLWGIPDDDPTLYRVAQRLGADVAFFLEGGCCEYVGKGEEFSRRLEPMKLPVVLVKPDLGVSTKRAYDILDKCPHKASLEMLSEVKNSKSADAVPLFNSFDEISDKLDPVLSDVKHWLAEQAGVLVDQSDILTDQAGVAACGEKPLCMLTGSGAATFAIVDSFSDAARIVSDAKAKGYWARATTFCLLKAAVI